MLLVLSHVWSGAGTARSVRVVYTAGKQGFPTTLLQVQMNRGGEGGESWRVSGFGAPLSLAGITMG